jgi:hypothetical protein
MVSGYYKYSDIVEYPRANMASWLAPTFSTGGLGIFEKTGEKKIK